MGEGRGSHRSYNNDMMICSDYDDCRHGCDTCTALDKGVVLLITLNQTKSNIQFSITTQQDSCITVQQL